MPKTLKAIIIIPIDDKFQAVVMWVGGGEVADPYNAGSPEHAAYRAKYFVNNGRWSKPPRRRVKV